jgi:hypothetical protein
VDLWPFRQAKVTITTPSRCSNTEMKALPAVCFTATESGEYRGSVEELTGTAGEISPAMAQNRSFEISLEAEFLRKLTYIVQFFNCHDLFHQ